MDFYIDQLNHFSLKPEYSSAEYKAWVEQDDFVHFLQSITHASDVILYASVPNFTFIYGILVPERSVTPPNIDDLDHWSSNPYSSWGVTISYGKRKKVSLSPPLGCTGTKTLDRGEQVVFARQFDGREDHRSYIEISQKLTHSFGLHWVPEREAYCRFDDRGDVEDVIRVANMPSQSVREGGRVVTILRSTLDEYLTITRQALLLLYDSTRFEPNNFGGWLTQDSKYYNLEPEIYFRMGRSADTASYIRGFQIIRPLTAMKDVIRKHDIGESTKRQYARFIAYDWKHGEVHECSCDPVRLGNYFVKSDLPYELSPVFFRPEVIQKYKADTDKYQLHDRAITCRHVWHLETYDLNEAGQVHTYLIYLSYLPYEEQLYWKSFNEAPKAPISRRAFQTDFEGKWDLEYDPLHSLKKCLSKLHESQVSWWRLRSNDLPEKVHYPVTKAADEWAKEIHALDKLVVEGFDIKDLRTRAIGLKQVIDSQWGSLKILEEVLRGHNTDSDSVQAIIGPLRELNGLRSKISGHASGEDAKKIKAEVLKKHKAYSRHFRDLCARCDESMRNLQALL